MNKIIHPIEPEELMAYLDGELMADSATATAEHLGECRECQRLVTELRSVSQNLKGWTVEPSEAVMPTAIAHALAAHHPGPRNPSWRRGRGWRELLGQRWATVAWVGAVAAAVLLTVNMPLLRNRGAQSWGLTKNHLAPEKAAELTRRITVNPPPPQLAAPLNGRNFTQLQQFAELQPAPPVSSAGPQSDRSSLDQNLVANGPMIIRTAQVSLITKEFDKARASLEAILRRHHGYVGELNAGGNTGSGRTLSATLRVPADQLDATLIEIKALGRVESEAQTGQDVTSQYVDLQARLGNARNTEERLTDLLRNRTGKLSDVLAVEQELDRVRGEIEQMEAERKNMSTQVSYATVNATITEDYKAELQVVPPSSFNRLSNAAVEGYRGMVDGVVGLALFLLSIGPSMLLWGAVLFFPARLLWRRARRRFAS